MKTAAARSSASASLRRFACALSAALLTTVSARAEAPAPSAEFWNYMAEFGDAGGNVFDPSDYAAVAAMPAKAVAKARDAESNSQRVKRTQHDERAQQDRAASRAADMPNENSVAPVQEQSQ